MKKENGITLTSLVIYIMGLLIVIGTLSMFLSFYYSNVKKNTYSNSSAEEYSKFTMYITNDINSENIINASCETNQYIYFKLDNEMIHGYVYQNKCIYYIEKDKDNNLVKQIELCKKVEKCEFNYNKTENSVNVIVNINGTDYNNIYTNIVKDSNF